MKALLEFLDRLGPEVVGHAMLEAPDPQSARQLDRFAQGTASDRDREKICEMLKQNPGWIRWVADRVKLARTPRANARA